MDKLTAAAVKLAAALGIRWWRRRHPQEGRHRRRPKHGKDDDQ